jgi:hypothetical protein
MALGCLEIVKELQKDNPGLRFAVNKKRNAVAYWAENLGRWQVLLCLRPDGSWGRLPDILVDGKPLIPDSDWDLEINNQQSTTKQKGEK